jgi:hypothetical protein
MQIVFRGYGHGVQVEAVDHARIEPVKLGTAEILQLCIGAEWAQGSLVANGRRAAEASDLSGKVVVTCSPTHKGQLLHSK